MMRSSDTVEDVEVIPQEIGPPLPQVGDVDNRPALVSPYPGLIELALTKKAAVEILDKLFDLQIKWEKNEAEKAFNVAMANFKAEPLDIIKDAHVEYINHDHASLGTALKQISLAMAKHGLNVTWRTSNENELVSVTCRITHSKGHYISSTLSSPPDTSGGKKGLPATGSAITFLCRYTVLPLAGLAATPKDDDGAAWEAAQGERISLDQRTEIQDKLKALKNEKQFLAHYKIESLDDLPASQYQGAIVNLQAKEFYANTKKDTKK